MLPAERLDRRGRVHVADRDDADLQSLSVVQVGQLLPGIDGLFVISHVGHGTPGAQVREDDLYGFVGEDVRGLGHEVDAGKDDVLRPGLLHPLGGELAELEAVAGEVGIPDHLVLLVVVSEDNQLVPHLGLARRDGVGELVVGHLVITVGQWWLPQHDG